MHVHEETLGSFVAKRCRISNGMFKLTFVQHRSIRPMGIASKFSNSRFGTKKLVPGAPQERTWHLYPSAVLSSERPKYT